MDSPSRVSFVGWYSYIYPTGATDTVTEPVIRHYIVTIRLIRPAVASPSQASEWHLESICRWC
jgi:hypothetical protein